MNLLKYYLEKYKIILIFLFFLFVILISFLFYYYKKDDIIEEISYFEQEENYEEEAILEKIKVDIKGQIKSPGVYELDRESRVIDVIDMAGGFTEHYNAKYLNLSKKIEDQMVIIVYSNDEIKTFENNEKETDFFETKCDCPDNINDACIEDGLTEGIYNSQMDDGTSQENTLKVSINTATLEELMTLTGIGQSKAEAIIEYREQNGKFEFIEDILNVSGIGESVYSKIKDNIKV